MTRIVIDPHLAQCLRDNEPTEPADCLAALVQRRAECDELRAEVARLREALRRIGLVAPVAKPPEPFDERGWQVADTGERHAEMVLAKDPWLVADFARTALTDGGGK
jgi:hypothetical protein